MEKRRKLPAELWDHMHYMFDSYNDRMIHVTMTYDGQLDTDAFCKVFKCFMDHVPTLHSSFHPDIFGAHWNVKDYKIEDVVHVIQTENMEEEADRFLMQYLPAKGDIQVQTALITNGKETNVCLIVNHMCMDGGDLKVFLKQFCTAYTNYLKTGKLPSHIRQGSRSFKAIYRSLSKENRRKAKWLIHNPSERGSTPFPWTQEQHDDAGFCVHRTIDAKTFAALRAGGKKIHVTVNEMFTAAFLESMYDISGRSRDERISVQCAMDLRRHMEKVEDLGFTNHTAYMLNYVNHEGADIFDTLYTVRNESQKGKSDQFSGMYGLPLLNLAYTVFPLPIAHLAIKLGYSNPLLSLSNIGILEAEKLALGTKKPVCGFVTGAVKYKPYFLVSATTLNGEMTMAACERGNRRDKELVNQFFDCMERCFAEIIEGTKDM